MLILGFLIVALLADVMLFAFDKFIWSFIVFAATIGGAYYFVPEVTQYVGLYDWFDILVYGLPTYLAIGAITAAVKWVAFSHSISQDLGDAKDEFNVKYKPLDPTATVTNPVDTSVSRDLLAPAEQPKTVLKYTADEIVQHRRQKFVEYVKQTIGLPTLLRRPARTIDIPNDLTKEEALIDMFTPRTRHYLDRITFWVLQWPIVLVAFILEDLLIKFGRWVARLLDTVFNRMSRAMIGKSVKGL